MEFLKSKQLVGSKKQPFFKLESKMKIKAALNRDM